MTGAHTELHFKSSNTVRDIVLGMADGLTVPFALAAGLTGTDGGISIIVAAGAAEIAAGSIAMGLGGYLAGRTQTQHYYAERAREEHEIIHLPHRERAEVVEIMAQYGLSEEDCAPLLAGLERNPHKWRDFMMRFELGLDEPDPKAARKSAWTIAVSYAIGGVLPLAPYVLMRDVGEALLVSSAVTLSALFMFGYLKGRFTGTPAWRSALQTLGIGGAAAAAAFLIARAIS